MQVRARLPVYICVYFSSTHTHSLSFLSGVSPTLFLSPSPSSSPFFTPSPSSFLSPLPSPLPHPLSSLLSLLHPSPILFLSPLHFLPPPPSFPSPLPIPFIPFPVLCILFMHSPGYQKPMFPRGAPVVRRFPGFAQGYPGGKRVELKFNPSRSCRQFMMRNFDEVCRLVLKNRNSRNPLIQQTLLVLLPRIAALNQELFALK